MRRMTERVGGEEGVGTEGGICVIGLKGMGAPVHALVLRCPEHGTIQP